MIIDVPTKLEPLAPRPPVGIYTAKVADASIDEQDNVILIWKFNAVEKEWKMDQKLRGEDLLEVLTIFGFAGVRVILPAGVVGCEGRIEVSTFGNRKFIGVSRVLPLT